MSNFIPSSKNPNYSTPKAVYDALNKEFSFNYDPCPLNPTPFFDGLKEEWGSSTFVNPPYTGVTPWIEKALMESKRGKIVVMLLRGDTSTKWFHDLVLPNAEIRFIRGRVKFKNHKPAPFPSIIAIFRLNNFQECRR